MQDSQVDTIQQRLQQASAARAQEAAGGEVLYAGDADMTDDEIAALAFDLYRQSYQHYWRTHTIPGPPLADRETLDVGQKAASTLRRGSDGFESCPLRSISIQAVSVAADRDETALWLASREADLVVRKIHELASPSLQ